MKVEKDYNKIKEEAEKGENENLSINKERNDCVGFHPKSTAKKSSMEIPIQWKAENHHYLLYHRNDISWRIHFA